MRQCHKGVRRAFSTLVTPSVGVFGETTLSSVLQAVFICHDELEVFTGRPCISFGFTSIRFAPRFYLHFMVQPMGRVSATTGSSLARAASRASLR